MSNPFDRTNPTMRDCWDAGYEAGVAARDQLVADAVAKERERCAKVCESLSWSRDVEWWLSATKKAVSEYAAQECAAAIRAHDALRGGS